MPSPDRQRLRDEARHPVDLPEGYHPADGGGAVVIGWRCRQRPPTARPRSRDFIQVDEMALPGAQDTLRPDHGSDSEGRCDLEHRHTDAGRALLPGAHAADALKAM